MPKSPPPGSTPGLPAGPAAQPAEVAAGAGVDTGAGAPDAPSEGFEAALDELEGIVARMEAGELTLEQSLAAYKRGAELLQFCQGALRDAQQQVKILEEGLLKDFGGGAQPD